MKPKLTINTLLDEAKCFCFEVTQLHNKELFGVTDGKAIGTYIEHKFKERLSNLYDVKIGSSASGIDLPSEEIMTDIKVTSIKQPQSSSPFKDAKQKIYGLGYNLLIFVYDKIDYLDTQTSQLKIVHSSFISKERTADYTATYRIREMLSDNANIEDIIAYLQDRNIPADEITLHQLAVQIMNKTPNQGYLTISNALQWRLQYQRIVTLKDKIEGIFNISECSL